ncbi:putative Ig domain-containing protein [Colwellia piezophila]|uniref:putative Ig domain-containing protein n=1 Tax=Colwellia piezophila TaxID=211668 RepID=UPI0003692A7A|nr:putative Ig domain-containing protein [Colwellia piezophila]
MNAHLCLKRTKIAAALLLALPVSFVTSLATNHVNAKEAVFLNNSIQQDELVNAGKIITKDNNDDDVITLGVSSTAKAIKQAIVLDANNVVYSAYISDDDDKAYVMKLVDNVWVSANPENTTGAVSTVELLAKKDEKNATIVKNSSLALAMGTNNEPHLAYVDENGAVVIEKLAIDENGMATSWQQVAKTDGVSAQFLRFKLDSNNNPYVLYGAGGGSTANVTLVKYDIAGSTWSTIGDRAITSVKSKGSVAQASFALNSADVPYLAFNNGTLGLDNNKVYVQKLVDDIWTTVGTRTSLATNSGVGQSIRALEFTVSKDDVPYVLAESFATRLSVAKFTSDNNEDDWQVIGGQKINVPFQTGGFSSIPADIKINVDAQGTPYIVYQDINSRDALPKNRIRVLRLESLLIDGELTDVWQQMDIGDDIIVPTNSYSHRYNDVVFDSYNRAYVTYQDVGGSSKTKVLRADVENNTNDEMLFTLDERSADTKYLGGLGRFDVETDSPVTLELVDYDDIQDDLKTADLFEIDPVTHELRLKFIDDGRYSNGEDDIQANDGINDNVGYFGVPSYRFKVKATNASGVSGELPVRVEFQEVEEFKDSRPFEFKVFPTCPDTGCAININENEVIPFEAIKSKIDHFEVTGTLPDGVTGFDASGFITETEVDGEVQIQQGKVSYISGGTGQAENEVTNYPLTLTAYPNDSAAGSDPISLDIVITVSDIEMNVVFNGEIDAENPEVEVPPLTPAQAYSTILNEKVAYSVIPDTAIALRTFTIENKPEWMQPFDESTGELTGTPSYEQSGEYSGMITGHGFDGELVDYPFTITVEHVPLNLVPVFVNDVFQDAYLSTETNEQDDPNTHNVNENLDISIANITTVAEDKKYEFTPKGEAGKSFSIEGIPSWAVFDPDIGLVSGTPSYTDEGNYSFTITGYGFNGEAPESVTVDLTVEHTNAPPTIEHIENFTTEENKAISINLMAYVPAVDVDGDTVFLVPDSVQIVADKDGELGIGELTQTQNGFIYTPATGDRSLVIFEFAVSDTNGEIYYVKNKDLPRVGINVQAYENQSIEQTSTGGSFGGALLAFFGLIFGARLSKRKV